MNSIHRKFIVSQGQSLLKILHLAINFFLRKNGKKLPCVWAKNGHDTLFIRYTVQYVHNYDYPISRKYSSAEKFAIFATLGS